MAGLIRFGVSADEKLMRRFDRLIEDKGYVNRSEAIRDLMRNALVEEQLDLGNADAVGSVTLLYDHHYSELSDKLTEHQHTHHEAIISSLHIHLDGHNCLEVVLLRGKANEIKRLADELISTKGVKHGRFTATAAGEGLV